MADYIRARSAEHKAERIEEIMNASEKLFSEGSYHNVSLTNIAKELGWSRANLYKYVDTKEEIFLALYLKKQEKFVDCLLEKYNGREEVSDEEFSSIWARTFEENLEYPKYQELQHSILETNVDVNKLADFQRKSNAQRGKIYPLIKRKFTKLDNHEIKNKYLSFLYMASGLYAHTHYYDAAKEAMKLAEVEYQLDEFYPLMKDFLDMALYYNKKA